MLSLDGMSVMLAVAAQVVGEVNRLVSVGWLDQESASWGSSRSGLPMRL